MTALAPWLEHSRWPTVPIRYVARLGTGHTPSRQHPEYWENCTIPWLTLADVGQLRDGTLNVVMDTAEKISTIGLANSAAVKHPAGTVVLSRTASVGFSAILGTDMATSQDYATWTCGAKLEPRFLLYALRAMAPDLRRVAMGSTHKTVYMPDIADLRTPIPPLAEQRRIADFLDRESARINALVTLRTRQLLLHEARQAILIDGFVAGASRVLRENGQNPDVERWRPTRLGRECDIISGFAFPSDKYVGPTEGVPLLRGVNLGVGVLDWSDTVAWDARTSPVPRKFHLRAGDLVMGMDRPWISGGIRLTFVGSNDLPALLLQRVACIRARGDAEISYIRWVIASSLFRDALESEMTGVSVPHVSGDQIGRFFFLLPPRDVQASLASLLTKQARNLAAMRTAALRQLALLDERKYHLIVEAVTGRLNATPRQGANLT